jgi:hypothetical protein
MRVVNFEVVPFWKTMDAEGIHMFYYVQYHNEQTRKEEILGGMSQVLHR